MIASAPLFRPDTQHQLVHAASGENALRASESMALASGGTHLEQMHVSVVQRVHQPWHSKAPPTTTAAHALIRPNKIVHPGSWNSFRRVRRCRIYRCQSAEAYTTKWKDESPRAAACPAVYPRAHTYQMCAVRHGAPQTQRTGCAFDRCPNVQPLETTAHGWRCGGWHHETPAPCAYYRPGQRSLIKSDLTYCRYY